MAAGRAVAEQMAGLQQLMAVEAGKHRTGFDEALQVREWWQEMQKVLRRSIDGFGCELRATQIDWGDKQGSRVALTLAPITAASNDKAAFDLLSPPTSCYTGTVRGSGGAAPCVAILVAAGRD
jgi:hypothetical protein